MRGARYIQIFVPCRLGWGSRPADTLRLAHSAVESGPWPLFEAEHGEVVRVTRIRRRIEVAEYLAVRGRFAHVLRNPEQLERIQAIAGRNIERFGLIEGAGGAQR